MEWLTSFSALPFIGKCLFHRRHKLPRRVVQQVRCPLYEEEATVQANMKEKDSPHYYTDITACSLLSQGPFTLESSSGGSTDMPYYGFLTLGQKPGPVYEAEVNCRKTCLATLNYAEKNTSGREHAVISGVIDSTELAQRVSRRKDQTLSHLQAPWSYGV